MPPAARVTDMHVCPMVTVLVPHVGGPILPPGVPTVLIDFLPAATVTSMATCVGPPDIIVLGSMGVMIGGLPAARMGDMTAHGGVIILGSFTCMIGEVGTPSPGAAGAGGVTAGLVASGLGTTSLGGGLANVPKNVQALRTTYPAEIESCSTCQRHWRRPCNRRYVPVDFRRPAISRRAWRWPIRRPLRSRSINAAVDFSTANCPRFRNPLC